MKISFALVLVFVFTVLFVSGCLKYGEQTSSKQQVPATVQATISPTILGERAGTKTVEITSNGFFPSELTVNVGETVIFVNKDSAPHRPASDVHPTHTVYPEQGGCIGSKFDACKPLAQEEYFSFTFNHKGTWNYHDHLNPAMVGTITVK